LQPGRLRYFQGERRNPFAFFFHICRHARRLHAAFFIANANWDFSRIGFTAAGPPFSLSRRNPAKADPSPPPR
jgi:hypothetical protein